MLSSLILIASTLLLPVPLDDAAVIAAQSPIYPVATCVISGEALGGMGEVVNVVQDGRLVKLCCEGCVKKLAADPAAAMAKLDQAVIADQRADYALDVCAVSGEAFGGEMGEPIEIVVAGRYIKLCCKGCVKSVRSDTPAVLAKVDAAALAAQRKAYPLTTCPISDEPLGDTAVEVMVGTTLVNVCCKDCKRKMATDPTPGLMALAKASAARGDAARAKVLEARAARTDVTNLPVPSARGR